MLNKCIKRGQLVLALVSCIITCFSLSASLPLITIAVFSSQGNNCPDAINMADHIDQWLNLKGERNGEGVLEVLYKYINLFLFVGWIPPASWSSVYGGPHPKSLY